MDPFEGAAAVGNHSLQHHLHHGKSCCSDDDVDAAATDLGSGGGNKRTKKKVFLSQSHPRNKTAMFFSCHRWNWIFLSTIFLIMILSGWSMHIIKAWKSNQEALLELQVQQRVEPLARDYESRLETEKRAYDVALQKAHDDFQERFRKEKETFERTLKEAQEAAQNENKNDHVTQQEEEDQVALQSLTEKLREMEHLVSNLEGHVQSLKSYKEKMHKAIQHMSRTLVLEKFGPGPHRVELTLAFDPADPGKGDANRIVLELAPLDEMPHTIFWFLSQVSLGLWNGCSFHRNADHVIQSGATRNFQTPAGGAGLAQKFIDAGYESVLFQEYSPNFPHAVLTVGYAGRPGGPDFYISIQDNTSNHGPGGQGSYDDPGEADPCFAKVVEGEDAVWRMHALSTEQDDYQGLVHNVAIVQIKLLSSTSSSLDQ